jgi:hypothetical protein
VGEGHRGQAGPGLGVVAGDLAAGPLAPAATTRSAL